MKNYNKYHSTNYIDLTIIVLDFISLKKNLQYG